MMWIDVLKGLVWALCGSGITLLVQLFVAMRKRARQGKPSGVLIVRNIPTILLYVAIIGTLTGGVSGVRQANYAKCQAEVNAQFLRDIETRTTIAADDRQAVDDLVSQIGGALQDAPDVQTQDVQRALASYAAKRAVNDQARPALTATGTCKVER